MARKALLLAAAVTLAGCLFGGDGPQPDLSPRKNNDSTNNGTSGGVDAGPDATLNDMATNADPGDAPPDMVVVPSTCGDNALQANETCDPALPDTATGACPTSCDDGAACTADVMVGAPETCDAACENTVIDTCVDGDGCCPSGCGAATDTDCTDTVVCGDGVLSGAEICDPNIMSGAGVCPTLADCPDVVCQVTRIAGSPNNCNAMCVGTPISACVAGDGCCAPGCDSTNDADCVATCGNGVIEAGETCDGNCPTTCDDTDACTTDVLVGSAANCDATCENTAINVCMDGDSCCPAACTSLDDMDCSASCGNGTIEGNETCDGNCPTTCNDNDACTIDNTIGSAANCNLACTNTVRTTCAPDGCCAPGCNANNDPDCASTCGNGIVEPPETCDGACPTTCNDNNVCTTDSMSGTAVACSLRCTNAPITACVSGDGCCAPGCNNTNDSDCGAVCGNAIVEGTETCDSNCPATCDDGNACTNDVRNGQSNQCNVTCSYSPKTSCVNNDGCCPAACNSVNDNDCSAMCGNGITEPPEKCDGANCPTAMTCAAISACHVLTGSAGQCTAQCVPKVGCVACTIGGNCPCGANQECNGGVCETPNAGTSCTSACNQSAYCGAWGGSGWVCEAGTAQCQECLLPSHCEGWEGCDMKKCVDAPTCDKAYRPDTWCQHFNKGDVCQAGICVDTCTTAADCPEAEQACHGGFCEKADDCGEARRPSEWCVSEGQGEVCVKSVCFAGCPNKSPCACPKPHLQECVQSAAGDYYCPDALADSCTKVCPANDNDYCIEAYGAGWGCKGGAGDGCVKE